MHLDEEQVQRLLHGELPPPATRAAHAHLAGCGDCRWRVGEVAHEEDEVHALLRALDHPPPSTDVAAVMARARARKLGGARWAAGIVLALVVTGVAYATPGSPLRAWVRSVREWVDRRDAPVPKAPRLAPAADAAAGIAVPPGRTLTIVLTAPPRANGYARVVPTAGAEVVVRTLVGHAGFTADVDRLIVATQDSAAAFEIQIPHAAPRVDIRVNGERVFLKAGDRITAERSADPRGFYLLPLRRPGP